MLFIVAGSIGCRIAQLLGLEIKDALDDFTTVHVTQQAKGTKVTSELRTVNLVRFLDIRREVAAPPKEFRGSRMCSLVFSSRTGEPRNPRTCAIASFTRYSMRKHAVPADADPFWVSH